MRSCVLGSPTLIHRNPDIFGWHQESKILLKTYHYWKNHSNLKNIYWNMEFKHLYTVMRIPYTLIWLYSKWMVNRKIKAQLKLMLSIFNLNCIRKSRVVPISKTEKWKPRIIKEVSLMRKSNLEFFWWQNVLRNTWLCLHRIVLLVASWSWYE